MSYAIGNEKQNYAYQSLKNIDKNRKVIIYSIYVYLRIIRQNCYF